MNLENIRRLVSQGEGEKLEFKKKANHPDRIINELVAFANTNGGILFIGVDDYGSLSGLKFPDEDKYHVLDLLDQKVRPKLSVKSGVTPLNQRKGIVWFEVMNVSNRVYSVIDEPELEQGTVYFRIKDESIKASPELRRILRNTGKPRGRTIQFSEIESSVLKALESVGESSLTELILLTGLKKKIISNCLVNLVLANVLRIIPGQPDDLFTFNDEG